MQPEKTDDRKRSDVACVFLLTCFFNCTLTEHQRRLLTNSTMQSMRLSADEGFATEVSNAITSDINSNQRSQSEIKITKKLTGEFFGGDSAQTFSQIGELMSTKVRHSWMVFLRHKDYSFWWLNQLMLFNHSETMPIGYEQLMNPNATHPYAIKLQRDWNSGRFGSPAEWVVKHVSREIVSPEQYKFIPKDGLFLSHSDKD